jgi:hypothetical protein
VVLDAVLFDPSPSLSHDSSLTCGSMTSCVLCRPTGLSQ